MRQAKDARPSAECSCGRLDRSAQICKPDTSDAASCDPIALETALASVQAPSSNPISCQPWSASKSRPPMNHCKTDLGIQNRPLHAEFCQSSANQEHGTTYIRAKDCHLIFLIFGAAIHDESVTIRFKRPIPVTFGIVGNTESL